MPQCKGVSDYDKYSSLNSDWQNAFREEWDVWENHRRICSMTQREFLKHLLALHSSFCLRFNAHQQATEDGSDKEDLPMSPHNGDVPPVSHSSRHSTPLSTPPPPCLSPQLQPTGSNTPPIEPRSPSPVASLCSDGELALTPVSVGSDMEDVKPHVVAPVKMLPDDTSSEAHITPTNYSTSPQALATVIVKQEVPTPPCSPLQATTLPSHLYDNNNDTNDSVNSRTSSLPMLYNSNDVGSANHASDTEMPTLYHAKEDSMPFGDSIALHNIDKNTNKIYFLDYTAVYVRQPRHNQSNQQHSSSPIDDAESAMTPDDLTTGNHVISKSQDQLPRNQCVYCDQIIHGRIYDHLQAAHTNEEEIQAINRHNIKPGDSSDVQQHKQSIRRRLLTIIRNRGNHHHNCEVIERERGELLLGAAAAAFAHTNAYEHQAMATAPGRRVRDYIVCMDCYMWVMDMDSHDSQCPGFSGKKTKDYTEVTKCRPFKRVKLASSGDQENSNVSSPVSLAKVEVCDDFEDESQACESLDNLSIDGSKSSDNKSRLMTYEEFKLTGDVAVPAVKPALFTQDLNVNPNHPSIAIRDVFSRMNDSDPAKMIARCDAVIQTVGIEALSDTAATVLKREELCEVISGGMIISAKVLHRCRQLILKGYNNGYEFIPPESGFNPTSSWFDLLVPVRFDTIVTAVIQTLCVCTADYEQPDKAIKFESILDQMCLAKVKLSSYNESVQDAKALKLIVHARWREAVRNRVGYLYSEVVRHTNDAINNHHDSEDEIVESEDEEHIAYTAGVTTMESLDSATARIDPEPALGEGGTGPTERANIGATPGGANLTTTPGAVGNVTNTSGTVANVSSTPGGANVATSVGANAVATPGGTNVTTATGASSLPGTPSGTSAAMFDDDVTPGGEGGSGDDIAPLSEYQSPMEWQNFNDAYDGANMDCAQSGGNWCSEALSEFESHFAVVTRYCSVGEIRVAQQRSVHLKHVSVYRIKNKINAKLQKYRRNKKLGELGQLE